MAAESACRMGDVAFYIKHTARKTNEKIVQSDGFEEAGKGGSIISNFGGFENAGELQIAILKQVISTVLLHVVPFEQFGDFIHQHGDKLQNDRIAASSPCRRTVSSASLPDWPQRSAAN